MKLAIFGAAGATGKELVTQALAAGHQVVAFARDPLRLNIEHEHLTNIHGGLTDQAAIERTVSGTEAVISVLAPRGRGSSKGKPITRGMQNILDAMRQQGVRRLIIISTPGASDPNDLPDFRFKVLVTIAKLTDRAAYEEIVNIAATVRASDRDWTIVRVSRLNNNPKSGKVRAGYLGRGQVGANISRADIADFMLKQVQDTKYLRQAPAISN